MAIHPPRVALVDGRGNMTREWYDFFARLSRDLNGGDLYSAGDGLDLSTAGAFSIANGGVSSAMIRNGLGCSVIGRYQGSTGAVADIVASADDRVLGRFGGQLEFRAIGAIGASVADADYGDITVSGVGTVFTVDPNVVTYAKMQDIATDTLIGRDTAGTGDPEAISVTGGIEFSGAGSIRTSAFTGDVTKAAGGTVTTIAADAVTFAKMQNIATDSLIGRDTAAAGDPENITLTGGLEFDGALGLRTSALTGDATKTAGGTVLTLATVNANVGSFGTATQSPQFTVNGKGLITAAANVTITPAAASITGGAALTKADDTNVTMTLGGTPATSLLAATSLTLGWTGTLAVARGGTGGGAASGTLLDNISGFASTGLLARTGAGTYAFRTLTAPAAGITVSNGDGVAGNPTLALANDLSALEALSGTNTIYYRSAADTWSAVTVGSTLSFSSGTLKKAVRGAMVKKAADLVATDLSAGSSVAFDSEVYDTDTIHDNVTNNTRLTTISGQTYAQVGATITFANVTVGTALTVIIRRNGVTSYDGTVQHQENVVTTAPCVNICSGPIPVTGGTDYFELFVFMVTDTSVDITAARTNFWMEILE